MERVCGNSPKPPGNRAAACETDLRTPHNKCSLWSGRRPLGTRCPGPRLPGICPFPAGGHACGALGRLCYQFLHAWLGDKQGREGRQKVLATQRHPPHRHPSRACPAVLCAWGKADSTGFGFPFCSWRQWCIS